MRDQPKRPFVRRLGPRLVVGTCVAGMVLAAGSYLWSPNRFGPANRRHTRVLMHEIYDALGTPDEDRVLHPPWSESTSSGDPDCPFQGVSAVGIRPYRTSEEANPHVAAAADVFESRGWEVQRATSYGAYRFTAHRGNDGFQVGGGGLMQILSGRCDENGFFRLSEDSLNYRLLDVFDE